MENVQNFLADLFCKMYIFMFMFQILLSILIFNNVKLKALKVMENGPEGADGAKENPPPPTQTLPSTWGVKKGEGI